jgi:mannose-6-phosphate isomerase-like protein (cupin superfamily)
VLRTRYPDIDPFVTRDGSTVRELLHPQVHGNCAQSLAEAVVAPGDCTRLHWHERTEELYHITAGEAVMTLGAERFSVRPGDTVCIPPGTRHCIENSGSTPLHFLCCCAPAYAHGDTFLV